MKRFTNLYPVSKTLRFELKPVGKTLENINKSRILEEDKHRAASYQKVKKIIDDYHKYFIDKSLNDLRHSPLEEEIQVLLTQFHDLYCKSNRSSEDEKQMDDCKASLRDIIVKGFTGKYDSPFNPDQSTLYSTLFKKDLIEEVLPDFVKTEEEKEILSEFKGFTTYFIGFHENRKNIYSKEAQSTAIAYRLIHENLPRFIDNINQFAKIQKNLKSEVEDVYKQFSDAGYMNVSQLEEMFSLKYFTSVLTQNGIEVYNAVIGKVVDQDGGEIKGLNERVNLYNQKQKERADKLPLLKPLYKQILSDREQLSWLPDSFERDSELIEAVKGFYTYISDDVLDRIRVLMSSISDFDLSRIYLKNDSSLTFISKKMLGNWNTINMAREMEYDLISDAKKDTAKYEENRAKTLREDKSIDIAYIDKCLSLLPEEGYCTVEDYLSNLEKHEDEEDNQSDLVDVVLDRYKRAESLLNSSFDDDRNLIQEKENVTLIKALLDSISELQKYLKPLNGSGDEADKDENFYGEFNYIMDSLDQIIPLYNKVRSYLTRKPYSTEKIKVNFSNSQLLNGWDRNKETANTSILLRKDDNFYLAIMDKKHNRSFENPKLPDEGECYEKMDYKLLPGPNKMLPKVFLSKKGIATFNPSKEIQENYKRGTHKKGENFNLNDLHKLIDFFKTSIQKHDDWSQFNFIFSDTDSYQDISGFYREVEQQGYKLMFRNISKDYIHRLVDEGKLYLFQIYNKDFSPYSKGTPNLHTLYWKMLFDEQNLSDVVYKLNGQAEIFFRKRSLKYKKPTHPANTPIKKKNELSKGEESLFTYDLIKDKRYTVDKFQFHVPITMNFKGVMGERVNQMVQDYIRNNDDIHIIGIDRGERHLLYVSVIDTKGKIVEQFSLNQIVNIHNNREYRTDYHSLLEKRDEERLRQRQNWQTIEGIKELKQGYLSQVVHKITQLMVKYNAIVAMEDLNMGFKRGRQKVESSVYQQFEKQLIDKLNYLVDKKVEPNQEGGLLKAYQFTAPFKSFREMGKQNGFLFYIPAWNTSKIDPITGFVNLFDIRYENIEQSKLFFSKFERISYNKDQDWFEFEFDYDKFNKRAEGTRTKWTMCTYGERIRAFINPDKNNQWDYQDVELTKSFKDFFEKYSIDYQQGENLITVISNQSDKDFFVELLYLLRLVLQLRNSRKDPEEDYIISPVIDASGCFFDTRKSVENLPQNADANGAYNIALKGLWAIEQIRQTDEGKNPVLSISNKQWLSFVQEKPYLKDYE